MTQRLRNIAIGCLLVGIAALVSACTTAHNSNRGDFQYQPGHSRNPACSQGFRPTNALSCAY
nr:hypothetical protein [Rhizobium sp. CF142]